MPPTLLEYSETYEGHHKPGRVAVFTTDCTLIAEFEVRVGAYRLQIEADRRVSVREYGFLEFPPNVDDLWPADETCA